MPKHKPHDHAYDVHPRLDDSIACTICGFACVASAPGLVNVPARQITPAAAERIKAASARGK